MFLFLFNLGEQPLDTPRTLGERLRKVRGNIPQSTFSSLIGINQNTLSRYERDERTPDTDVVVKIGEASGASLEWLLTGRGDMLPRTTESPTAGGDSFQKIQQLETRLELLEAERREVSAENRQLYRDKAELLREIGELRAAVARWEERQHRYECTHGLPAKGSGVA